MVDKKTMFDNKTDILEQEISRVKLLVNLEKEQFKIDLDFTIE